MESAQDTKSNIARFRALPPAQYPRLIEIATAAESSDAESEFDAGLAVLIAGLDARA